MADDWKASLPDDLKAAPSLQDVKDIAGLARAFVDTKSMLGSSIRIPSADAAPAAKEEFRQKLKKAEPDVVFLPSDPAERAKVEGDIFTALGRPAKADEYTAEGLEAEVDETALRTAALEMGLTKAQYQKLAKITASERKEHSSAIQAGEQALRSEWGAAFDDKVSQARAAALKLGVPATEVERLPPAQLKVWANVAASVSGGSAGGVAGQGSSGGTGKLTPAEAKRELRQVQGNPAYFNRQANPVEHARLVARAAELTAMM